MRRPRIATRSSAGTQTSRTAISDTAARITTVKVRTARTRATVKIASPPIRHPNASAREMALALAQPLAVLPNALSA